MKILISTLFLIFNLSISLANVIQIPIDYPTIQEGINAASANDTILIKQATYTVDGLLVDKPLTIASFYIINQDTSFIKNTVIKASDSAGKEWFLISRDAANSQIIGLRIIGNNNHTLGIENTNTSVKFCQFIGGKDQLSFEGSPSFPAGGYVGYCYFEGAWDDAIDCDYTTSWIIEYNTIVNSHQDGTEVRMQEKPGPMTTHIYRYNTIINPGESGIQFIDYPDHSFREFQVYGNIFKNCNGVGVSCMYNTQTLEDFKGSDMEESALLYNNTFVGCNYGITEAPYLVVLNNIFVDCRTKGIGESVHVTAENNHSKVDYCTFYNNPVDYDEEINVGSRIFSFNPNFANTIDYGLQANSGCIDKGTAFYRWEGNVYLNLMPEDYIGAAPDLGAVEYQQPQTVVKNNGAVPNKIMLYQNFPNPFNPETNIRYTIGKPGFVSIRIFDILGRLVTTLEEKYQLPGDYTISWKPSQRSENPWPSGIYFCQLRIGRYSDKIKLMLIE